MAPPLPRHTTRHRRTVAGAVVAAALAVVLAGAAGAGVAAALRERGPAQASPPAGASPTSAVATGRPGPATAGDPSRTSAGPAGASPTSAADPPATSSTGPDLLASAPPAGRPTGTGTGSGTGSGTAPPVAVGAPAPLAPGVSATVRAVTPVRTVPGGPGDLAGPGVVVRLAVRNDGDATVDLAALAVTASASGAPARASGGGVAAPLTGSLDPGSEATGTYVFRTATAGASPISVEVGLAGSAGVRVTPG